jgi:hypothetical protein
MEDIHPSKNTKIMNVWRYSQFYASKFPRYLTFNVKILFIGFLKDDFVGCNEICVIFTFRVSSVSLAAISSILTYVILRNHCSNAFFFAKKRISEFAGFPKRPGTVVTEEERELMVI